MATISKAMADKIIANDGYFSDDPRVLQVVEYTNMGGTQAYAILYEADVKADRYQASMFVQNPKVIWSAK